MSTELISKAVLSQFIVELFENFSDEHLSTLVTDQFKLHAAATDRMPVTTRKVGEIIAALQSCYRNPRVHIVDLLPRDNKVVARYFFEADYLGGLNASRARPRRIRVSAILIGRFEGGKLAECWWEDRLGMLSQPSIAGLAKRRMASLAGAA